MKVTLVFLALCAIAVVSIIAQQTHPVDWHSIIPMSQMPGFLENYPLLMLLYSLFNNPLIFPNTGTEAAPFRFPYQAGIVWHHNFGNTFCGGAVISDRAVVTAAHCTLDAASGIAIFGARDIQSDDDPGQLRIFFEMDEVFVHPNYFPDNLDNDIACIVLREPIEFNDYIRPIRLPNLRQISSSFENQATVFTGWGRSLFDWWGTPLRPILRYVEGTVLSSLRCRINYPTMVGNGHMCTIDEPSLGACPGDSGGPLVVSEFDGEYTLVGIASFISGLGCEAGRPAVHTRVAPQIVWISQVTGVELREDF